MDMRRIAISSAWSAFVRQKEWSESIAGDQYTDFDALYRRYYPSILVFLCFLVGKAEVAEDLASLVFEKALVHLADVRTPDTGTRCVTIRTAILWTIFIIDSETGAHWHDGRAVVPR